MSRGDEHITRAARAIAEWDTRNGSGFGYVARWEDLDESQRDWYRNIAAAALGAVGDVIPPAGEIEDGYGSVWERCAAGADCALDVVRPGKVQCECDGMEMPIEEAMRLAKIADTRLGHACFLIRCGEEHGRELERNDRNIAWRGVVLPEPPETP